MSSAPAKSIGSCCRQAGISSSLSTINTDSSRANGSQYWQDAEERFEVVDLIGEQDAEVIAERARQSSSGVAPIDHSAATPAAPLEVIRAEPDPPSAWTYDPLGFFLIHVERERGLLRLEHYGQDRRLLHTVEGESAAAVSQTAVRQGMVSLLAHAAYLGRELAKAEAAL